MAPQSHHATAVAFGDNAVLITGAAGSGKSTLALQLMAMGGVLVVDDQAILTAGDTLNVQAPDTIHGQIEARGIGILNAPTQAKAAVTLVVDLDQVEDQRLPEQHQITLLGCTLPLLRRAEGIHFASAIAHMMRHGRSAP